MQNISNKDSEQSSVHSTSNCVVTCPSWWHSSGSHFSQSSFSKNLRLNAESPRQHCQQTKQSGLQLQEQDSSSTQSTGQSHQELAGMRGGKSHEHCFFSTQSGNDDTDGKRGEGHMKSILTLGSPEIVFPAQKLDYAQSVACIPYPYAEPFYGGVVAAYGPNPFVHPQMVGITSTRVPLPLELAEDEPIYVNAKQYRGILRRRQLRAKLEAQNKLVKGRKPYLHESRHRHAMKRARGSGGRFLNKKQQQFSESSATTSNGHKVSGSVMLQLGGGGSLSESEVLQSDNGKVGASTTTSCSEATSIAINGDMFQMQYGDLRFSSDFHSHVAHAAPQHRVSVMR